MDLEEIDFDFTTYLTGFDTTVQSGLIDLGTNRGTNIHYPDRGNDFEAEATSGYFVEGEQLQHSANFTALDTKAFINKNIKEIQRLSESSIEDTVDREKFITANPIIRTIDLVPSQLGLTTVVLQSVFVSANDEQIGQEFTTVI